LGSWFVEQVKQAVAAGMKIDEERVMVEITFDPPWSQELMSEEAKANLGF
jgi:metal-sulfur cluster biosynthetic enzyme